MHQMIPYMGYLNYTEIITTSNGEYSKRYKVHSATMCLKFKLMSGPSCSGEKTASLLAYSLFLILD